MYGVEKPLPASEDLLCLWVTDLARRVGHAAIRNYLYAVRSLHVDLGLAAPVHGLRLLRMLKGVRRRQVGRVALKRMPITTSILAQLRPLVGDRSFDACCLMSAFSFATAGLLRGKEFAAVRGEPERVPLIGDLTIATASASLHLRVSKTDPFGRGTVVRVAQPAAITDLHRYLALRPRRLPTEPLFALSDGTALPLRSVMRSLRLWLGRAGVDCSGYRGFSFRRGGATSLAEAGVPDRIIKELGRWKSWVYSIYIATPEHRIIDAAAAM
jgi:hypothetical protein